MAFDYTVVLAVLTGLYSLLAITSLIRFFSISRVEKRKSMYKKTPLVLQKSFHFLVFITCLIRIIYNNIPDKIYVTIIKASTGAIYFLDLIPETIYIFTFCLIMLSWIEVYFKSRGLENKYFTTPKRFWGFYIGICVLIELIAIFTTIALEIRERNGDPVYYETVIYWEVYFLASITFIVLLATILSIFSIIHYHKNLQVDSPLLNNIMAQILLLIVITALALLIKVVYNLIVKLHFDVRIPAIIFFMYFFIGEILPSFLIIIIMYNVLHQITWNCISCFGNNHGRTKISIHEDS